MSVYKMIEVIGTSKTSWEDAARVAIETAGESLRDLRVARSPNSTSASTTARSSSTARGS